MSEEENEVTTEPVFEGGVDQDQTEVNTEDNTEVKPEVKTEEQPEKKPEESPDIEDSKEAEKPEDTPRKSRQRRRTQQYISGLKHDKEAAKEDAAYWKGRAEALEETKQEPQRPDRVDYVDEDQYLDAVLDYRDEIKKPLTEPKQEPEPQVNQAEMEKRSKLETSGSEKFGSDFHDALTDDTLAISTVMGEYVLDSELGADVFMQLADNPERAHEIFKMNKSEQYKALSAIEDGISEGVNSSSNEGSIDVPKEDPPKEIPQRKVTKAPPPPSHEKSSSAPEVDDTKLSDEDWFKREKARAAN